MASACLIINEWLLHDLRGDNGREKQAESYRFLERLKEKCDHLAVLSGSPWMIKAYELMKHSDLLVRRLSKYLHLAILKDPAKCLLLSRDNLKKIPDDVKLSVSEEDVYLVECYYSANANLLVTTDQKLHDALLNIHDINIQMRSAFIQQYLLVS